MGPARMSAEERRSAILDAALPLFADLGLHGVTTRQIAEAAGVSEALMYKHFSGKEELFVALQHHCVKNSEKQSMQSLEPSTSTLVLGIYFWMKVITGGGDADQTTTRNIRKLFLTSALGDGEFVRGFTLHTTLPLQQKLAASLKVAEASGDLRPGLEIDDTSVWLAHACAIGLSLFGQTDRPMIDYGRDLDGMLRLAVPFVLRGLGLTEEAIQTHFNPAALELGAR